MKFKNKYLNESRADLAKDIRRGNLSREETEFGDNYSGSTDDTDIQLQDRETHTHHGLKVTKNRWGNDQLAGKFEKSPRVSSYTWGRIWKNGELEKQFEGPKYQVRQDMAKYLDDTNESLDEATYYQHQLPMCARLIDDYETQDPIRLSTSLTYCLRDVIKMFDEPTDNDEDIRSECEYMMKEVNAIDLDSEEEAEELNNIFDKFLKLCKDNDVYIPGVDIDYQEADELLEADLNPNVKKAIKGEYKAFDRQRDKADKDRNGWNRFSREYEIKNTPNKEQRKANLEKDREIADIMYPKIPNSKFKYSKEDKHIERENYPFYVTYYAEYPIYEPAEGGYYYAGAEAIWSQGFNTQEEARQALAQIAEEEELEVENPDYAIKHSKYVGEEDHAVVETSKNYLKGEHGWEPYQ